MPASKKSKADALLHAIDQRDAAAVRSALADGAPPRAATDDGDLPDALCRAIAGGLLGIAEALADGGASCAGRTRDACRPIELLIASLSGKPRVHEKVAMPSIAAAERPAWIRLLVRLAATSLTPPPALAAGTPRCWDQDDVMTALLAVSGLRRDDLREAVLSLRPDVLERLLGRYGDEPPAAPQGGMAAIMQAMQGDILATLFDIVRSPRHAQVDPAERRARTIACARLLLAHRGLVDPAARRGTDPLVMTVLLDLPELVAPLIAAGFAPDRPASCHTQGFLPTQADQAIPEDRHHHISEPGVTPLTVAVRRNAPAAVDALLDAGAGADAPDGEGITPLSWAERLGRTAIAHRLAERGATARSSGTPLARLIAACIAGDAAQVRELLAGGAPSDGQMELTRDGRRSETTPLMAAVEGGSAAVVALLLPAGAEPDHAMNDADCNTTTPFILAAEKGRDDLLTLMLPHVVDRTQRMGNADPTAGKGDDLPTVAARSGKLEAVRVLLDAGWPASGEALHAAVEKAALASARLLVERGARIDALDSAGNPVLSVAIQLQGREVPDTSAGPGVTVWNSERPRVAAAPSAEIDAFVRFLLARGAKVDLTARQKGTRPLCAAAEVGRGDWVELLLERGAAIEPPFGHLATTPLLEAVMHGHAELIPMLIARGADLHRRSPDGDGVVWRACCINQNTLRTLPLLLERGANPNHGDGNRTPLDILQYSTHADAAAIIALLRQYGGKSGDELAASKPVDSAVAAQAEPLPDFSGKTSKRFRERAAKLAKPHGFAWQEAADIRGTLIVSVATTIADQVMEPAAIAKRLEEGLLVMAEGSRAVRGDTTVLRAIPSKDWADALRCAQTNGCNYDLMPDDIIRWLRRLEREQPFTITAVAHDVVEGRFEGPIADPKALAKRMYRFCPDLVDQGCGTVEALAKTLVGENPQLYFWWD